ncbi:MAG: AAA family ATPase, partial [Eubacteriaceae bacterium]|nr:AAA family ATPase [Eubacteriaceae bacterium]
GVGAGRIHSLFEKAEKKRPCIIFIDEIDAIGVQRNTDNNSERDQTLNQLLIEMDGFVENEGTVVLAATNRIDMLDRALLRPGRFDRQIYIGNPHLKAREAILELNLKNKPVDKTVDVKRIATKTNGLSGAHLANIVNESALLAIRKQKDKISNDELEEALVKTTAGLKNKDMVISDAEKLTIAFHESGHALAETVFGGKYPDMITVVPHGASLGFTMADSTGENTLLTKEELMDRICVLLAGRAAEENVFSTVTTGAQNDLERANSLAEDMVCTYGMSAKFNNRVFRREGIHPLGAQMDMEISSIINSCYEKTKNLLKENEVSLSRLSKALYENEVLRKSDIESLIGLVSFGQSNC